jgi:arsenate reductase
MPDKELSRHQAAKDSGIKTILFVCSGNSIRSQIAEGLVNHFFGKEWVAFSAGTIPMPVPKDLVKVMREIGIDISTRKGKHVDIFRCCSFDRVVVLCSDVNRLCPTLPDCAEQEHIFIHDPLSAVVTSEGFFINFTSTFRQLRDEMKKVLTAYMKDA